MPEERTELPQQEQGLPRDTLSLYENIPRRPSTFPQPEAGQVSREWSRIEHRPVAPVRTTVLVSSPITSTSTEPVNWSSVKSVRRISQAGLATPFANSNPARRVSKDATIVVSSPLNAAASRRESVGSTIVSVKLSESTVSRPDSTMDPTSTATSNSAADSAASTEATQTPPTAPPLSSEGGITVESAVLLAGQQPPPVTEPPSATAAAEQEVLQPVSNQPATPKKPEPLPRQPSLRPRSSTDSLRPQQVAAGGEKVADTATVRREGSPTPTAQSTAPPGIEPLSKQQSLRPRSSTDFVRPRINTSTASPRRSSEFNGPATAGVEGTPRSSTGDSRRPSLFTVRPPTQNKYQAAPLYMSMKRIASPAQFAVTDSATWDALLDVPKIGQPTSSQEAFDLEMATLSVGEELIQNNVRTANFSVLLIYLLSFIRLMRNKAYDGNWSTPTYNALFMVRVFTKHFVGNLDQAQIYDQYESDRKLPDVTLQSPIRGAVPFFPPADQKVFADPYVALDKRARAEVLMDEVLQLLIYSRTDSNPDYEFYTECLNLLTVMFSTQLRRDFASAPEGNYFLDLTLQRLAHYARGIVGRLYSNVIDQQQPPPPAGGVLSSAYSYLFSAKKQDARRASPLGDKSVLLLVLLGNQAPPELENLFREAVGGLGDVGVSRDVGPSILKDDETSCVSFRRLYLVFCGQMDLEDITLLFYMTLEQNNVFRGYVLSRTDPESLMLPLLKSLYELGESKEEYPRLYVLLTILTVLSGDEVYNESMQQVIVPPQGWYTQAVVKTGLSLSGLMLLVLIRAIQANLAQHKDTFIHTNCLAILSNIAGKITGMHLIVAQKFVSLFEVVSRRYLKLHRLGQGSNSNLNLSDSTLHTFGQIEFHPETDPDTQVYGDLIAGLLEFFNAILSHTLKSNPHFIYALLHRREMLEVYKEHGRFGVLVGNIDLALSYFSAKLGEISTKTPSAEDVLGIIEQAMKTWPVGKLKVSLLFFLCIPGAVPPDDALAGKPEGKMLFADIRFRFEEDHSSPGFFLPYAWSLAYQFSMIFWDDASITLLNELLTEEV
ncbi:hypothetical protein HDV00_007489 [Rhizophlyctis rosea]|nr:hypothetical protein HDV00_007489 [Rhizophlyctis rosea]